MSSLQHLSDYAWFLHTWIHKFEEGEEQLSNAGTAVGGGISHVSVLESQGHPAASFPIRKVHVQFQWSIGRTTKFLKVQFQWSLGGGFKHFLF